MGVLYLLTYLKIGSIKDCDDGGGEFCQTLDLSNSGFQI